MDFNVIPGGKKDKSPPLATDDYILPHPDSLAPKDRRDFYISEEKRIIVEKAQKKLIDGEKMKVALAKMLAEFSQSLQSLPDTLERRTGMSPQSVAIAVEIIHSVLNELADKVENELFKE